MTALSLEFQEIERFLDKVESVRHPEGIIYKKGIYETENNIDYEVLLVESGSGNVRAADETARAIQFYNPEYSFFVGIAGGIKDVDIGDIVVSTKVIGFETGKADESLKPRFDTIPASYVLEQIAKHVNREGDWTKKFVEIGGRNPKSYVAPIASGEKVISSKKSDIYKFLKANCSDALAVDMEGSGFLIAARPYKTHAIEIRGISDLIDGKAKADASGTQPKATKNAAYFTFEMIEQLTFKKSLTQDLHTQKIKNKLVDKLTELYEQGPEQDSIWQRAGGDVSILSSSSSRKAQWYNAIDKLSKGGGGDKISLESLINQVNADYPNSDFIDSIFK